MVALAGTNVVLTRFNRKLFGDDDGALDTRNYSSFENERSKVLHTILMGFSTDPFVRWICPDAFSYSKFIGAFDAFGGGAIENSSAYVCGNFQGAALWLPPAQESDEERFIQEVEANVLPERHETLFRISTRWRAIIPMAIVILAAYRGRPCISESRDRLTVDEIRIE